jgi:hypothetical protein
MKIISRFITICTISIVAVISTGASREIVAKIPMKTEKMRKKNPSEIIGLLNSVHELKKSL